MWWPGNPEWHIDHKTRMVAHKRLESKANGVWAGGDTAKLVQAPVEVEPRARNQVGYRAGSLRHFPHPPSHPRFQPTSLHHPSHQLSFPGLDVLEAGPSTRPMLQPQWSKHQNTMGGALRILTADATFYDTHRLPECNDLTRNSCQQGAHHRQLHPQIATDKSTAAYTTAFNM